MKLATKTPSFELRNFFRARRSIEINCTIIQPNKFFKSEYLQFLFLISSSSLPAGYTVNGNENRENQDRPEQKIRISGLYQLHRKLIQECVEGFGGIPKHGVSRYMKEKFRKVRDDHAAKKPDQRLANQGCKAE